ncbi:MAG: hypothetical protein WB699_14490 [Bacteroidota bacterium]
MRAINILTVSLAFLAGCDLGESVDHPGIATNPAQWEKPALMTPEGNNVTCLTRSGSSLFAGMAAAGMGVYKTTDHGESWTKAGSVPFVTYGVVALLAHGPNLFAGAPSSSKTGGGGCAVSTDNGADWTPANNGLGISQYLVPPSVYSFTSIGKNVYLAAIGGVYASTDEGSSWSSMMSGNVYAVGSVGQVLFATYADYDSIFRSTDAGQTWTTQSTGVSGHPIQCFFTMGDFVFAGGKGVLRSSDFGQTWVEKDNGMLSPDIRSFTAYDSVLFAASYGQGVYQSWDKGETWASINPGLESLNAQALLQDSTYLYVGTADAQVWRRPLSNLLSAPQASVGGTRPSVQPVRQLP